MIEEELGGKGEERGGQEVKRRRYSDQEEELRRWGRGEEELG